MGDFVGRWLRVTFIGDANVWGEGRNIIHNDKHYAACRKESLTGFMLVGRLYRLSRQEGLSCCYLINIPYSTLQHIRDQTV